MKRKYSEIRKKLNFVIDKNISDEMAHLTHFFHNQKNGVSQYYKPVAEKYLCELHESLGLVEEPSFQSYLPFEWDIPFPSPKRPKFEFIDLFAGIGGVRLAYQNIGGKCVFSSEWDSYAKKTYEAIGYV